MKSEKLDICLRFCLIKCNRQHMMWATVAAASAFGAAFAYAAPMPPMLVTQLNQREQKLEQTTTVWRIEAHAALAPQIKAREQKLPASERSPVTLTGATIWRIVQSDGATLVSGGDFSSVPQFASSSYNQFYSGSLGMVFQAPLYANRKRGSKAVRINVAGQPIVWPTPGDSRLFPSPISYGLPLAPMHFVALAGVSPIGLYGAHWTLISETAKTWVLEGNIASSPFMDAKNFRVVLNRSYGNAPLSIQMRSLQTPAKEDWEITEYRKYKDVWIGSQATHFIHAPGIVETRDIYILQSLSNSRPITLPIAAKSTVRDYRLVADQLSEQDAIEADNHHKRGIVYYPWKGQLPSRDDLKKLRAKQNPGEATPDPARSGSAAAASDLVSSVLPFAGAVMLLTGGVWLFKQRKAN